jgi:hypothetical protein
VNSLITALNLVRGEKPGIVLTAEQPRSPLTSTLHVRSLQSSHHVLNRSSQACSYRPIGFLFTADHNLALIRQHHVLIIAITRYCENIHLLWIDSFRKINFFVSGDEPGGAEYSEYDQL